MTVLDDAALHDPQHSVSCAEAAELIGVPEELLREWRVRGEGPPWFKASGGAVRYRAAALRPWIERIPR